MKENSGQDRKQKIRDKYKGTDASEIEIIPAKPTADFMESGGIRRVAAYVRVSTDNDEQTSSYELQKNYYTEYITGHPGWELVGIYADEGISGTSIAHRKGMLQMIEDCKAGKIDLIMTKSIARFARNIVDCLSVIDLLKNLEPPVGVQFEADNIYTLDNNGRMILTILASVAEEESHSKSVIMNWSIERRFRKGLFLTPELLGYDRDEDGDLIVNEDEAETVKAIYYLYLNGVSFSDIAELLKAYKRKTKQGSYEWSASTLAEIVANERHCGDIRAWKTFTPNFLTHKAKKNNGERTQFRRKNHHEAIVFRTVYEAANFLRASRAYAKKARPLPVLSVVDNGILRGYVPLDKDWTGFSTDEYQKASESVMSELEDTRQIEYKAGLDMRGYEVVRSQYFSTTQNPAMTIADGKLSFNTACLKKFENVEYVELLLNSVNRCIAVRPCDGNNPNAIHWGKLREGRWCALSKSCRGLAKTLFDIMDWDQDLKYRFRGDFIENDDQKVMLFQLDEPEMVKTENIVLPPKEAETDDRAEIAGRTVKQIIYILPPEWEDTFGRPITSIGEINLLEQRHYAADWDVLRPAKELAEYSTLTSEDLEELLQEAEKIIEGWPIPDEHGTGETADNGDGESADVGTECGSDVGEGTEIEQTFDYDGYQVARRELFAHLRDPAIIIRKDSITFNTACIAGLEDVVYVNIMFNSDLKRLVVKGCNENDRDALRWCIAKPDKRKSRKMSCRLFSELLYKEMDWSGDCRYKILGYRIEFEGEALYVFDLVAAEVFHERKKKQSADQLPATEAEENKEEQPVNPRKGYYPEDIAGTFGMPVEQHRQESELRQMDGFVSVGMLTGMPGQQQNL